MHHGSVGLGVGILVLPVSLAEDAALVELLTT